MADERIKLILNVSGVQDVSALKQEMQDLAEALGVADAQFEKIDKPAKQAAKSFNEVAAAAREASGNKSKGGQGLSGFAYAVQDLQQGGLSAVLNNVQQLAMGLGLGAGVAGGAQLALTAVLAFRGSLEKLLEVSEPIPKTLKEFADETGGLKTKVDKLKESVDELAKSEDNRAENLVRLRSRMADAKNAQDALNKATAAAAEAEKLRNDPGIEERTEAGERAKSFKESVADTGKGADFEKRLVEAEQAKAREAATGKADYVWNLIMQSEKSQAEFKNLQVDQTNPETGEVIIKGKTPEEAKADMMKRQFGETMLEMNEKANETGKQIADGIIKGLQNPKNTAENDEAFAGLQKALPNDAEALRRYHQQRVASEALDKEVDESGADMKARRVERERAENAQQAALGKMGRMLNKGANVEEQAEKAADRAAKQAAQAEADRIKIRDRVMAQNNLTPEGMAAQRQNAGVGATAAANRNRAATANNQEARLSAEFQRHGMTADEAAKTTREVSQTGDKIVRTMIESGRATLNRFKQIELTQAELARMMAQQAAGQVGMPGRQFNAGRR